MEGEKQREDLRKKEKALKISYKRRKQNLLKKGYELATLCDVDLCLIIFDPKQGNERVKPVTWPVDARQVEQIIRKYKRKEKEKRAFLWKKPGSEQKVANSRKQMRLSKYPLWDDRLNGYSEEELEQLLGKLDAKLKVTDEKIKMIKDKQPEMMVKDKSQVVNELELELSTRTESPVGNASSSGQQQCISDVNPVTGDRLANHFQGGYQGYPHMIPWNPYFWGNWQQLMLNGINKDTEHVVSASNVSQFTQLNAPICSDQRVPFNMGNTMYTNANPWLSSIDPSMQFITPFWQFPVMVGVPPQISTSSQSKDAIDFFAQDSNNDNARS